MNTVPEFEDLTKEQVEIMCNGCGSRHMGWIIPEWCFTEACNQHDFYYWRGCTEEDRKKADDRLYRLMLDAIEIYRYAKMIGPLKKQWFKAQAWAYYTAVRFGGRWHFEYRPKCKTWYDVAAACYPVPLTPKQQAFFAFPSPVLNA